MAEVIDNPMETLIAYISSPLRSIEGRANFGSFNRFFIPTEEFLNWMANTFPNKTVIDCGCGIGHVTEALRSKHILVLPVDLYPSPHAIIEGIFSLNSAMFSFDSDMVALLCRPCRGDWIHATIIRAVEGGATMVYVGKESHYEDDLAPLPYKVEKILTNAGEDGESVWVITK